MKTSKIIKAVVALVVVVVLILLFTSRSSSPVSTDQNGSTTNTPPVPVSETTKVSGSLSEYQNAELGFMVKYPSPWEKEETNSGVNFLIPIDKTQVSSVATLQGNVQVFAGTCAFPPVTTIKDRGTVKVGNLSMDTISMSNNVQGRTYFDRMYTLQNSAICYVFRFSSIVFSPASKGLSGSNATQAANNNKAIVNTADTAFTNLVKSFAFVVAPQGQDETTASPKK